MPQFQQNGTPVQTPDDVFACASGVAANTCVYLSAAGTVATADAGALATAACLGVVTDKPTTTSCRVRWVGPVDGFTGLSVGSAYFLGTAGAISTSPGANVVPVGIAETTTRLLVLPGAPGLAQAVGTQVLNPKVRCVATSNVNLTTGLVAGQTIDGVTLAAGDRVLLAGQTTGSQNGVYLATASGAASYAPDYTQGLVKTGQSFDVGPEGTAWANSTWRITATQTATGGTITLGTTDPALYPRVQSGSQALTAGAATVSGLFILSATGPISAIDKTAADAVKAVPTAERGTGSIALTGNSTDTILWSVVNF